MRKITQWYNTWTMPAKAMGYNDEKRLQEKFDDKRIKLRWNRLTRQCEVWYEPPRSQPYCVFAIENTYNICRAIRHLETAQRSRREQLANYLAWEQSREDWQNDRIKEISAPIADCVASAAKGKVSVTV
jgi:hypothetical protein